MSAENRILATVLVLAGAAVACRSMPPPEPAGPAAPTAPWDLDRAETIEWRADHPSFEQTFAMEASGLAASGRYLYVASEKYARLLQLPIDSPSEARTIAVAVPAHSELEGVAWTDEALYLCDEAHAAVYEVRLERGEELPPPEDRQPLPAKPLSLAVPEIRRGKIGVEGIAADPLSDRIWLLLERSGTPETGCVSTIFPLRRNGAVLVADGTPIRIGLADCNWRLTGLELWRGELLALKTQFPGERYEVIAVDPGSGAERTVLEMTELIRSVRRDGWHNNVEGIAVTGDGALWLVSDNDWTGVIDDPLPGPAREKTMLMRIPPTRPPR